MDGAYEGFGLIDGAVLGIELGRVLGSPVTVGYRVGRLLGSAVGKSEEVGTRVGSELGGLVRCAGTEGV